MNYQDLINKLNAKEPFAFSRWGDGEWACVNGNSGKNCDGHKYFKELGKVLRQIVSIKQPYVMGLQPVKHGLFSLGHKYEQDWTDADILHNASIDNELHHLFDALNNRNVVLIGNERHRNLPFINTFIQIPKVDAWKNVGTVWASCKTEMTKGKDLVFLFCAGMTTNALIDGLYKSYKRATYIDCGSVFDVHLGFETRSYHKKITNRLAI